jgi:hypothetical protein
MITRRKPRVEEKRKGLKRHIYDCADIRQRDQYSRRERRYLITTYVLIWGQCLDAMHQKEESIEGFKSISDDGDAIEPLKILKDTSFN